MFNVSQERLKKIGSELGTDIIGAQSGDYLWQRNRINLQGVRSFSSIFYV